MLLLSQNLNCAKSVVCLTVPPWKVPCLTPAPEFQASLVFFVSYDAFSRSHVSMAFIQSKHSLPLFLSTVEMQKGFTQDAFLENDIIAGNFHGMEREKEDK